MENTSPRPVLFTARGLELTTKGITIYAAFNIAIVISKIIADKVNMNELMPQNVQVPFYALLGIYVFVTLVNGFCVSKSKYNWLVAIASILILLACRFYYIPFANWIYSLAG